MKIVYNHEIFALQARGGISRYVAELHREVRLAGHDATVFAGLHANEYLHDLPAVVGRSIPAQPWPGRRTALALLDRAAEAVWLRTRPRPDVLHKSYFWPSTVPRGSAVAVTVYDMVHELFGLPDDPTAARKRMWCERADVVFTISDTTKGDLVELTGLPEERVVVTPLGVRVPPPADPAAAAPHPRPYLLYVGQRDGYKNWSVLIDAMAALGSHQLELVCFGGGPASDDERRAVAVAGLAGRVVWRGGNDDALAACYRHAVALVYPSRYEGFGLPPLEAMTVGCPVVAARAGSIPEVVGDAALLVDPDDTDQLADAIRAVLDGTCAPLVAAGRARAQEFTWARTAATTLDGYRRVAGVGT